MARSRLLVWLTSFVGAVAAGASAAGLFWNGESGRVAVTSVRGEEVELYGTGLYRYDTVFIAAGSRGTDAVTLVVAVPLLFVAVLLYRRGSVRGGMLLAGTLTYVLYVYASRSLGNAYNGLFLVYVAVFSASLFSLYLTASHVARATATERLAARRRRELAFFLIACAGVTAFVWLAPLLAALAARDAPDLLDTYTTPVTEVLDLGVLVPTLVIAAALTLRRAVLGYVLAVMLLILLVLIAATIVVGTVFQLAADVSFTRGEIIGPIAGFVVLAALAVWFLVRLFRDLHPGEPASVPTLAR